MRVNCSRFTLEAEAEANMPGLWMPSSCHSFAARSCTCTHRPEHRLCASHSFPDHLLLPLASYYCHSNHTLMHRDVMQSPPSYVQVLVRVIVIKVVR